MTRARCRICKRAMAFGKLPICISCHSRGDLGYLDRIQKKRYRQLFIDLTDFGYKDEDPNGYRFVRDVLIKNDISVSSSMPSSTSSSQDDHRNRNYIAIIGIILAALTIILRMTGFF